MTTARRRHERPARRHLLPGRKHTFPYLILAGLPLTSYAVFWTLRHRHPSGRRAAQLQRNRRDLARNLQIAQVVSLLPTLIATKRGHVDSLGEKDHDLA